MWTRGSEVFIVSVVPLALGLQGTAQLTIADGDTALAMSCGRVPTLATPRLIALCEQAAIAAIAGAVEETDCCVGLSVQIDHLRPTPIGDDVTAEAVLDKIDGKRLVFHVTAHDDRGLIAAGRMTRAILDYSKFMEKTH